MEEVTNNTQEYGSSSLKVEQYVGSKHTIQKFKL
jgi:hypothetical protein